MLSDFSTSRKQKSYSFFLSFLIYINDLREGVTSIVKLYAEGTSHFSGSHDIIPSAKDQNEYLIKLNNWASY